MENPIKMDDFGVPLFLETPVYVCVCIIYLYYFYMPTWFIKDQLNLGKSTSPMDLMR